MFFSSTRPENTSGPAGGPPPSRGLPAPSNPNEAALAGKVSADNDPSKEDKSYSGDGKQEVVRLKGQPPRPSSKNNNHLPLVSNHFKLTHQPNLKLWHYQIVVSPEIKGPKLTQLIKTALSGTLSPWESHIVTDFSAIMLGVQEIPQNFRNFKLQFRSELETQASQNAKEYTISLEPIGIVDLSDQEAYLQQRDENSSGLPVEQALDIILGFHRKLSDDIAIVNRRKAFSIASGAEEHALDTRGPQHLIARRGYFSSVRMSQSSLMVNINVSHGAFYTTPNSLFEIIQWLEAHPNSVDRSKVPGLLKGLRIRSTHIERVWSFWGFPRKGDGRGFMLHPPRFLVADATWYMPDQIRFFHETVKDPSKEGAQKLNDKDKASAKDGKLKAHDEPCSCSGEWITVADYFRRSIMTFRCLVEFALTD